MTDLPPPDESASPQPSRHRLLDRFHRRRNPRRRLLRSTAVLPAVFTLGNGLFGFASIHFATKDGLGAATLDNLAMAAWMIGFAMVCDMLDGRVARMTRQTSDFGGQLDSLSDVLSFGAAPAVLMLRTSVMALQQSHVSWAGPGIERIIWAIAAIYLSCTALRLARFNVENQPDESAHMKFRGLPSPGAAAPVATMTLLLHQLASSPGLSLTDGIAPASAPAADPFVLGVAAGVMPVMTLILGLLMVSRFQYKHVINQTFRGRRPVTYLVKLLIVLLLALWQPFIAMAALSIVFALSGPVGGAWRNLFGPRQTAEPVHKD
ncbi:MAG: CDP-alcohol phosphatidyltransferase family protein [Planctomycetaceae bacterium]|nr:CDP-alcohol phosphatidyltransferase family protein [Planctomycetaceae bacterium]